MSIAALPESTCRIDANLQRQRLVRGMKDSGFPWPFDHKTNRAVWEDVLECHAVFVKYECINGHRIARPKSCGFPLCPVCMPLRLRADFKRHLNKLPSRLALFIVRVPEELGGRTEIGQWFRNWRRTMDLPAGFYGVCLRVGRPEVLLVMPADVVPAHVFSDAQVSLVGADVSLDEAIAWYVQMFLEEVTSWTTPEEMLALLADVKGRRRFQGFGKYYAKKDAAAVDKQLLPEEPKKLHRASGGSGKGGSKAVNCPLCGAKMRTVGIALTEEGLEWDSLLKLYRWGAGPPSMTADRLPAGVR